MSEPIYDIHDNLIGHITDGVFVGTTEAPASPADASPADASPASPVTLDATKDSPIPPTPLTAYKDSSLLTVSSTSDFHGGNLSLDATPSNQQLSPASPVTQGTPASPVSQDATAPPAPDGDALLDLIDEVASTVERVFDNMRFAGMPRLHGDLRVSDGMHSTVLMDGVTKWGGKMGHGGCRSWIVEGTLRTVDELTPALQRFITMMQRKQRLRQIEPDWKFDSWGMQVIGSMFGLPAPLPLDEIAKRDAAVVAERQERQRRDSADQRKMDKVVEVQSAIQDVEDRISRLLRELSAAFYPMGDADGELNVTGDTLPAAYHDISKKRRVFKKFSEPLVRKYVEARATDKEIWEDMTMLNEITQGEFGSSIPDPLGPQDIRYYFTLAELKAFYDDHERFNSLLDRYDITTQLGMDARWVVTMTPRKEEEA